MGLDERGSERMRGESDERKEERKGGCKKEKKSKTEKKKTEMFVFFVYICQNFQSLEPQYRKFKPGNLVNAHPNFKNKKEKNLKKGKNKGWKKSESN